jgi:predicted HicB family RNase H-like nuclease
MTSRKQQTEVLGLVATPGKTKAPADTVQINVPLPAELHRRLRIEAINQGLSLKDSVIAAIEAWLP